MLPRLLVVPGLVFLVVVPALSGCSSSQKRDQYFGSDKGADYETPDAASFSSQVGADGGVADDAADTGLDAVPVDGSTQVSDSGFDS